MSEEQENLSTAQESFSDDDAIDGINLSLNFPTEAYCLAYADIKTSTPQISPNISPASAPKPGTVQKAITAIYSSKENISNIATRSKVNESKVKPRKMGKLKRLVKTFNSSKEEIEVVIKELEENITAEDSTKAKLNINKLTSYKELLDKDLERINNEEIEEKEEDQCYQLIQAARKLLRIISTTIANANDMIKEKRKPTMASGKLSKIEIPKFYGDYLKYNTWKQKISVVLYSCDEITQRIYIIEALKGKAYDYVEDLIIQEGSLEDILNQLDTHFGNEHHIIDASIKSYFELSKPEENIDSFEKFFIQSKNRAASLLTLQHDPEQLLAAYFMLQIPGSYRSEIDKK